MSNEWYIASSSAQLKKNQPLPRVILGKNLVLFRDVLGKASALLDLCPHRNVQLSLGRVHAGRIECAYHGWQFGADGKCLHIPSLQQAAEQNSSTIPVNCNAQSFQTIEQQGYVWVFMGDPQHAFSYSPFSLPHLEEPGFWQTRFEAMIPAAVENVIENFIDSTHTGYIHGGWFRTPASHSATATVITKEDRVIVETQEESISQSLFAKFFGAQSSGFHEDQMILPATVQVTYPLAKNNKIVGIQICTPVNEHTTRVYFYITWKMKYLGWILKPFVPWVGRWILRQDLRILENQRDQIRAHGKQFTSVPADQPLVTMMQFRNSQGKSQYPKRELKFRL